MRVDIQDEEALEELTSQYRGYFKDGYTSEMVAEVGELVERALGLPLVVVWAYEDMWGPGGDSEYFLVRRGERAHFLYHVPGSLHAYLWDEDKEAGPLSRAALEDDLRRLERIGKNDPYGVYRGYQYARLRECTDEYNLCWRRNINDELD